MVITWKEFLGFIISLLTLGVLVGFSLGMSSSVRKFLSLFSIIDLGVILGFLWKSSSIFSLGTLFHISNIVTLLYMAISSCLRGLLWILVLILSKLGANVRYMLYFLHVINYFVRFLFRYFEHQLPFTIQYFEYDFVYL